MCSIGSLGKRPEEKDVKGIVIKNCTFHGTTNGARIKTFMASPALQASDIVYEDIIMDDVKNPIIIDQHYNSKTRTEVSYSIHILHVYINVRNFNLHTLIFNYIYCTYILTLEILVSINSCSTTLHVYINFKTLSPK